MHTDWTGVGDRYGATMGCCGGRAIFTSSTSMYSDSVKGVLESTFVELRNGECSADHRAWSISQKAAVQAGHSNFLARVLSSSSLMRGGRRGGTCSARTAASAVATSTTTANNSMPQNCKDNYSLTPARRNEGRSFPNQPAGLEYSRLFSSAITLCVHFT